MMYASRISSLSLALLLIAAPAIASEEPLEKLVTRAEAEQDAKLFAKVSMRYADLGRDEYAAGEYERSKDSVNECSEYADKALSASKRGSYKIKDAEITLRKAQRILEDLAHVADVDDRPPIQSAAAHLAKVREDLLQLMFAK